MFSLLTSRLRAETNPLYSLRDRLRETGRSILDLVSGNVNEHGIVFPREHLEHILAKGARKSAVYRPDPLGQRAAREAIATYYAAQGLPVPPDAIVLTPGTSLSYWYCFALLADGGDEVLCPTPSYPLFDYIALMSGVKLISYPLDEAGHWRLDPDRLEASISTRTRAIVLISPHNPTGHVASREELDSVADIARRHDLAIISDEVFSEFLVTPQQVFPRAASTGTLLTITLNGFSKMFALPGMKLGWMALSGEKPRVAEALRTLELISDTFLPVNEVVQAAVPDIMQAGIPFGKSYAAEIRARWETAEQLLGSSAALTYTPPQGGFYVTVRLEDADEEHAAEALLRDEGLLVHPGYFYDVAGQHLVFSFVQEPAVIRDAFPRLLRRLESLA